MERILKLLLIITLIVQPVAFAEEQPNQPMDTAPVMKPYTDFSECIATFPVGVEKLINLTLCGINALNYQVKEIQTKSGYIIFETGYRKYLASIIYVSSTKSMIKITPYSGNYDFSVEVVKKLFNYISENLN